LVRLLASAVVNLLASAIALVAGALILDDMALDPSGLVVGAVVFTVASVVTEPLVRDVAMKQVRALLGASALLATLLSLIGTVLLTDGIRISGFTTWVLATIVVWLVALVAELFLPLVLFKKVLARSRSSQA
jgi:hypothetical protein